MFFQTVTNNNTTVYIHKQTNWCSEQTKQGYFIRVSAMFVTCWSELKVECQSDEQGVADNEQADPSREMWIKQIWAHYGSAVVFTHTVFQNVFCSLWFLF